MIRCDVRSAWRFYRLLRGWRRHRLGGHVWVRVDIGPDRLAKVLPRRYVADSPPLGLAGWCAHGVQMLNDCEACCPRPVLADTGAKEAT